MGFNYLITQRRTINAFNNYFIIGVLITYICSLLSLTSLMSWWTVSFFVFVSIAGMITINGVIAIICCKCLPKKWFLSDKKIFNPSKKECKFYEKIGIRKWKDKNIDLGKLNGFKKDKIKSDPEYIERFILECNMGFIEHFISIFVSIFAMFFYQ